MELLKNKMSLYSHVQIKNERASYRDWENIFAIHISDKRLVSTIYKVFFPPNNKTTTTKNSH